MNLVFTSEFIKDKLVKRKDVVFQNSDTLEICLKNNESYIIPAYVFEDNCIIDF